MRVCGQRGEGSELPGFCGECVWVVLRENQVHALNQIGSRERQMPVSVLEPT